MCSSIVCYLVRFINYTVRHKNIPKFFDRNLKTDYQILIIFGTNISDTTGHQMITCVPASPNLCFCTTWGKQNKQNITFFIQCNIII